MTVAAATPMVPLTCAALLLEPDAPVDPAVELDLVESAPLEELAVVEVESPASTEPVEQDDPTMVESTAALPAPTVSETPALDEVVVAPVSGAVVAVRAADPAEEAEEEPVATAGVAFVEAVVWPFTAATARTASARAWMNFIVDAEEKLELLVDDVWSRLRLGHSKVNLSMTTLRRKARPNTPTEAEAVTEC